MHALILANCTSVITWIGLEQLAFYTGMTIAIGALLWLYSLIPYLPTFTIVQYFTNFTTIFHCLPNNNSRLPLPLDQTGKTAKAIEI